MTRLIPVLALFFLITGCEQASQSTDPSVLASRTEAWEAALNAKDVDALAALYTDDARLLPPNAEATIGRDAVRAMFGGMIDAGLSADLTSIETMVAGDIGYDVGTFVLTDGDTVVDAGKFIEVFHRGDDGEWLIANDIWNSDRPAAAAAADDAEDGVEVEDMAEPAADEVEVEDMAEPAETE